MLKIFGFLLLFTNLMFANNEYTVPSSSSYMAVSQSMTAISNDAVEVSLDSFGTTSMIVMVILSSLLGLFFVRDEFSSLE